MEISRVSVGLKPTINAQIYIQNANHFSMVVQDKMTNNKFDLV